MQTIMRIRVHTGSLSVPYADLNFGSYSPAKPQDEVSALQDIQDVVILLACIFLACIFLVL